MIEDGAADAELRVRREQRLLPRVVLLHGVEQPDDPPRDEVLEIDVRRLPCCDALHDAPDERQVATQHLFAIDRLSELRRRRAARTGAECGSGYDGRHQAALPWAIMVSKKNCAPPVGREGAR